MIRAGELRNTITFQRPVNAPDGAGGSIVSWSNVASCQARVIPDLERTVVEMRRVTPELTHVLQIRYRTDITPEMRIALGARLLAMVGMPKDPDGRLRELLIAAVEQRTEAS